MDIFDDISHEANGLSEVGIHAGFPNPAAGRDHHRATLSLDQLLVPRPNSSYFFRITGHRWADQGINDGDLAIIDRAMRPGAQDLVLCWQDGFVLSRYNRLGPGTEPWGVITAIVHVYKQGGRHDK